MPTSPHVCERCALARAVDTGQTSPPDAPGPPGVFMVNGWWKRFSARWWGRGLDYELGTRVIGEIQRQNTRGAK